MDHVNLFCTFGSLVEILRFFWIFWAFQRTPSHCFLVERKSKSISTENILSLFPIFFVLVEGKITHSHYRENVDHVKGILQRMDFDPEEMLQYAKFAKNAYTSTQSILVIRDKTPLTSSFPGNLIGYDEKFTMLLLCWDIGSFSFLVQFCHSVFDDEIFQIKRALFMITLDQIVGWRCWVGLCARASTRAWGFLFLLKLKNNHVALSVLEMMDTLWIWFLKLIIPKEVSRIFTTALVLLSLLQHSSSSFCKWHHSRDPPQVSTGWPILSPPNLPTPSTFTPLHTMSATSMMTAVALLSTFPSVMFFSNSQSGSEKRKVSISAAYGSTFPFMEKSLSSSCHITTLKGLQLALTQVCQLFFTLFMFYLRRRILGAQSASSWASACVHSNGLRRKSLETIHPLWSKSVLKKEIMELWKTWLKGLSFSRYTRNLLVITNTYSLMMICWMPSQHTPVHRHEYVPERLSSSYIHVLQVWHSTPFHFPWFRPPFHLVLTGRAGNAAIWRYRWGVGYVRRTTSHHSRGPMCPPLLSRVWLSSGDTSLTIQSFPSQFHLEDIQPPRWIVCLSAPLHTPLFGLSFSKQEVYWNIGYAEQ